jgi:hypothetical protein
MVTWSRRSAGQVGRVRAAEVQSVVDRVLEIRSPRTAHHVYGVLSGDARRGRALGL